MAILGRPLRTPPAQARASADARTWGIEPRILRQDARPPVAPRQQALLEAPILPTLFKLAAPNIALISIQVLVSMVEIYFVGWLGAEALAGVSLAYPVIMLMLTVSAGGLGSGIASAVARSLGAGRLPEADALILHGLMIAAAFALLFTVGDLALGRWLFRAMGGSAQALDAALVYSGIVFGGAIAMWVANGLIAALRGAGVMFFPAAVSIVGALVVMALSPALILGMPPLPRLGVAGAGIAMVGYYVGVALVIGTYLASGRAPIRLIWNVRPEWRLLKRILHIGLAGMLNAALSNLNVLLITAFIGSFGVSAIAGYGIGSRLEYMQIYILFGFGTALVTMVGTNVGAGNVARARRITWACAAAIAAITATIGLAGAALPHLWVDTFTDNAGARSAGVQYLRVVGPTYGFFGAGYAIYFCSQGAGYPLWPLVANIARLATAGAGGALAVRWFDNGITGVYAAVATAFVIYSISNILSFCLKTWRSRV